MLEPACCAPSLTQVRTEFIKRGAYFLTDEEKVKVRGLPYVVPCDRGLERGATGARMQGLPV